MASNKTNISASAGKLDFNVFQADAAGNKIGAALDPSLYTASITQVSGSTPTVAGDEVTLADTNAGSFDIAVVLNADPLQKGDLAVAVTGEATQLIVEPA